MIVAVSKRVIDLCRVKAKLANKLTIDEVRGLVNWCDNQIGLLTDDLNLQQILNLYRLSAEWDTWEAWHNEDTHAAHAAYSKVKANP